MVECPNCGHEQDLRNEDAERFKCCVCNKRYYIYERDGDFAHMKQITDRKEWEKIGNEKRRCSDENSKNDKYAVSNKGRSRYGRNGR